MSNRLLIFSHDSGSANVTMAYAYLNSTKYTSILAFPKGPALKIYKQNIEDYISKDPINFLPTDTVVTGTSGIHSKYELEMIIQARISQVKKIIIIIDNIDNFDLRFTINSKMLAQKYFPDEIWVNKIDFTSTVTSLNNKLVYKEDIYEEYIQTRFTLNAPELQNQTIIQYKNNYLVILTEYLYDLYGDRYGFTEFDFLTNILSTIETLKLTIPILIKLHPAEQENKYDFILEKYQHLNIYKDSYNIHELIYYSKLIFGINSAVFRESLLFEKPTFSIQIGNTKQIPTKLLSQNNITTYKELKNILLRHTL